LVCDLAAVLAGLADLATTAAFLADLAGALAQAAEAPPTANNTADITKTSLADRLDKTLALNTGTTSTGFAAV
jgi:hypothetical protein